MAVILCNSDRVIAIYLIYYIFFETFLRRIHEMQFEFLPSNSFKTEIPS